MKEKPQPPAPWGLRKPPAKAGGFVSRSPDALPRGGEKGAATDRIFGCIMAEIIL